MIDQPLALLSVVVGLAALGFVLEARFAWARQLGASMLVIVAGAVVSNLGWVPLTSPVYDAIFGPVTSLAIVWLLLAVDLRDLRQAGPRMLGAFGLAVVGTCAGVLVATLALASQLGDQTWRLAGVMTGTYAGGSLNFVAVGRAVGLDEGALYAAATASDNVLTAVWLGATLLLPLWLAPWFPKTPVAGGDASADAEREVAGVLGTRVRLVPRDVLALGAIALLATRAADALASQVPVVPSVVWLTTLALAVGQVPWVRRLEGALPLGLVALHLFFVVIGIGSRISEIVRVGPAVFLFTAVVILVHGLVVFVGGRLLRRDLATLAVASQAAVGGPSTAMAVAVARGWKGLALPGVVVGLLGYAVGTYAGLAMAAAVRSLVGG